MNVITTVPSVQFYVLDKQGHTKAINAPSEMPDLGMIDQIQERFGRGATVVQLPAGPGSRRTACTGR